MGLLNWLLGDQPQVSAEAEGLAPIVAALADLPEDQARYLAAFSYILGRAAHADGKVTAEETQLMEQIIARFGHLDSHHTQLVVKLATEQGKRFGGTQDYVVTRQFRSIASDQQRRELLDCILAVCAADDLITADEDRALWQIASELGFQRHEFVQARLPFSDKRSVIRALRDS